MKKVRSIRGTRLCAKTPARQDRVLPDILTIFAPLLSSGIIILKSLLEEFGRNNLFDTVTTPHYNKRLNHVRIIDDSTHVKSL